MLNGINHDKSARQIARELSRYRQQARAAKLAARMLAADAEDNADIFAELDSGLRYEMPWAHVDGHGPDSDDE